jgi:hypothetical protein
MTLILIYRPEKINHPAFIALEVTVNFALLCELVIRIMAQTRVPTTILVLNLQDYVKYWGNYFDWLVFIAGIVTFALYNYSGAWFEDASEGTIWLPEALLHHVGVLIGLLLFRYLITILRVFILLRRQQTMFRARFSRRVGK